MLNRRRHGNRIFAYYLVELTVLAGAFFVAYWARQQTSPVWGLDLGPLGLYLWLLPLWLSVWSALGWGLNTYLAFRSRSLLWHGSMVGAVALIMFIARPC